MLSSRPLGITFEGDYRNFTKTPGRTVLKSRSTLQENASRCIHVPGTVAGKVKKAAIQHTPFHSNTLQPQKTCGTTKSKGHASRPLGDKTPFPNRVHNHATPFQVTKPVFDVTPGALLRPSSTRKHIRLPHSASKSFQTPVTGGNHWDVSDTDINPEVAAAPNQSIEEEDYDDIEYMPPKQPELPYEPPFELPDYKEVGKILLALTHSYPIHDVHPHVTTKEFTMPMSDDKFFTPDGLSLSHLDDDSPFAHISPAPKPKPKPKVTAPSLSKNATRPLKSSRTASTVAPSVPVATSRSGSGLQLVSRPGSVRPGPINNVTTTTRIASSATAQRGPISRPPSTRAPSTTVSRTSSTVAITRARPASTMPTGIRSHGATMTQKLGTQSRASTRDVQMNNVVQGVGIVFEDRWQEEEFRFSV